MLDYDTENHKALLISRYGLEECQYHDTYTEITWDKCSLRQWLNHEFLDAAFTGPEQEAILITEVDNSPEQSGRTEEKYGAPTTKDKVFLLSWKEMYEQYADYHTLRLCAITDYVKYKNGATKTDDHKLYDRLVWMDWLRSPAFHLDRAMIPDPAGEGARGQADRHLEPGLVRLPQDRLWLSGHVELAL